MRRPVLYILVFFLLTLFHGDVHSCPRHVKEQMLIFVEIARPQPWGRNPNWFQLPNKHYFSQKASIQRANQLHINDTVPGLTLDMAQGPHRVAVVSRKLKDFKSGKGFWALHEVYLVPESGPLTKIMEVKDPVFLQHKARETFLTNVADAFAMEKKVVEVQDWADHYVSMREKVWTHLVQQRALLTQRVATYLNPSWHSPRLIYLKPKR